MPGVRVDNDLNRTDVLRDDHLRNEFCYRELPQLDFEAGQVGKLTGGYSKGLSTHDLRDSER